MCHVRNGGSIKLSNTTDANLDCAFVQNALVALTLDFEKLSELPDLVSVSKERDAEEREITILS